MQKQYKDKNCMICNTIFKVTNPRKVYCSERCRFGVATCAVCGVEFSKKNLKDQGQEYCSLRCWYKVSRLVLQPQTCKVCNLRFQPRRSGQITCSYQCSNIGKKADRPFVRCIVCDTELPKYRKRTQKYCSNKCKYQNRQWSGFTHAKLGEVRNGPGGYRVVRVGREYVGAMKHGWILQHRYVMEQVLGRTLEAHERIHHKNGDRADNRPENLELWKVKKKDPAGVRAADYHCAGCKCFEEQA